MSWITAIWSATVGASLVTGLVYLLVWSQDRRSWANLCFFFTVIGVLGLAAGEMATMHASPRKLSGGQFGGRISSMRLDSWVRWDLFTSTLAPEGDWLLALAIGLRLLVVLANFTTGLNAAFSVIHSLQKIDFLGEQVSVLGEWVPSPWVQLGLLSSLVQFVYVADASIRLWRTGSHESRESRGGCRRIAWRSSSSSPWGSPHSSTTGVLRMPFILSFPFLGVVLAMGYELSKDVLRAAQLSRELRESEQRMALATEAANLGIWSRALTTKRNLGE